MNTFLRNAWARITSNKIVLSYFIYTLTYFFLQLSLQAKVYDINLQAERRILRSIPSSSSARGGFPIVEDRTRLRVCSRIPEGLDPRRDSQACPIVFDASTPTRGGMEYVGAPVTESTLGLPTATQTTVITTAFPTGFTTSSFLPSLSETAPLPLPTAGPELEEDDLDDGTESDDGVSTVDSLDEQDLLARAEFLASEEDSLVDASSSSPSDTCTVALQLPATILHSTRKEDLVFLAFQFWTLTMSLAALMNESIPYIIAAFITHGLNTAWGAFQVVHTNNFRADYERIVENGACQGLAILPSLLTSKSYWTPRRSFELPSLVIHISSLLISGLLTWRLVRLFGWNTFSRLGASRTRDRAFKVSLTLSSIVHLGVFFLGVQACLWVDELRTGIITTSSGGKFPMGAAAIPLLLILPWVFMGSYAIKQKNQKVLLGFALVTAAYIITTALFFVSPVYQWTFWRWRFFGIVGVLSGGLLFMAFGLAIACLVYWKKEERMGMGMGISGGVGSGAIRGDQESQRSSDSSDVPSSWTSFTSISTQSFASTSALDEKPSNPFSDPVDLVEDELSANASSGSPRPSVDYGALYIKYPLSNISPSSTVFPMRT